MTDTDRIPAVLYAAKSTEDKHGSIGTQISDCRAMAERQGWEIVGEFSDESASAYRGNRGPQLVAAMEHAERLAPCVLVVQHSDRLARGDVRQARHLVEIVTWAVKAEVTIRSVQDDLFADERLAVLMGALMGMRNTEDSARKSEATRAGIQRRKDRGGAVGALPLGYTVEKRIVNGDTLTKRMIDPATRRTIERIFDLIEAGSSSGDVARILNAEGLRGRRGGPWISRTVRKIIGNTAYKGSKNYPAIIDAQRFDAIHTNLARLDPVQVSKRQGGRTGDDAFLLRGVAFCRSCGAGLYTRRQAAGRVYMCGNRRQATGLCSAPPIPAKLIESHVLRHLDQFVGSVEEWIADRIAERDSERRILEANLGRQRVHLKALDGKRAKHRTAYSKLVDEGESTAYIALQEIERIDREIAEQQRQIAETEAQVAEWSGAPDIDAALDFYNELVELVQGRIRKAEGAAELNRALSMVVAGLWAEIETDRDRLLVEFELVGPQPEDTLPGGVPIAIEFKHRRDGLPPRDLDDRMDPLSPWEEAALADGLDLDPLQTGTQTSFLPRLSA